MGHDFERVNTLLHHLSSNDIQQRELAAVELGKLADQRALHGLLQALNDKDSRVRYAVTYALGKLQNEQAIPNLISMLSDKDDSVRDVAVESLRFFEKKSLTYFEDKLKDPNVYIRKGIAESLISADSIDAINYLLLLILDEEASVRGSAVWALGYFTKYSIALTTIKQTLNDVDETVRWTASEVLELHYLNSQN